MAEWDRLESRLKDLEATAAGWVEDPLDPTEVRRIGARRHRRRWAAAVTLAVFMVIAGGAGVYGVTAVPQHREPGPAAIPTVNPSPTPTEATPSEQVGHGRLETKAAEPRRQQPVPPSYPTASPTDTQTSQTPTPETPSATPTDDQSQTSEPEPSQTTEPEPGPTSEPTGGNGGGADQPTEPAPRPTDNSTE